MLPISYKPIGKRHGVVFLDNGYRDVYNPLLCNDPIIPRTSPSGRDRPRRGRASLWVAVYYNAPLPLPQDGHTCFWISRHRTFLAAEAALVRWMHGGRRGAGFKTCRMSRTREHWAIYCTPSGRLLNQADDTEAARGEGMPIPGLTSGTTPQVTPSPSSPEVCMLSGSENSAGHTATATGSAESRDTRIENALPTQPTLTISRLRDVMLGLSGRVLDLEYMRHPVEYGYFYPSATSSNPSIN